MRIIRYGFLLICCLTITLAQAESIDQKTQGWCSPAVNKTGGNVEIHCHGVSPKIVKRLEELLDKKDVDLINAKTEIDHWLAKYNELKTQLATRTDELAAKAKKLFAKGDLKGAKELLKQSLVQNLERKVESDKAAARDAYDLGLIEELQLDYVSARDYYEQAVSITPNNTTYLNQAGLINQELADFKKAIGYFKQALASDLKTYGEDHSEVATRRNNLGLR